MAIEVPQLRRTLFGYRPSSVDAVLTQRGDEIHALVVERNELAARLNEASTSLLNARRELTDIEAHAISAEGWISHLEAQSGSALSQIRDLEHQTTELGARILEERARNDEADQRVRSLEEELARERSRSEAVAAELDVANERLASKEAAEQERSREVERWRSDWRAVRGQLEATVRERDEARRLLTELRAREERASAAAEQLQPTAPAADTAEPSSMGPGDVVAALQVAERTMLRIVEENRRRLADDIEALERRRDEVLHEVSRWEEHTGRLRQAGWRVAEAARETREAIGGVDDAIRMALQPLVGSLSVLDEGIAVLDVDELPDGSEETEDGGTPSPQDQPRVMWSPPLTRPDPGGPMRRNA